MSRIGKKPIPVPKVAKVSIDGSRVEVGGPRGKLSRDLPPEVALSHENGVMHVSARENSRRANAMRGMARAVVHNMVVGVTEGFKKQLVIEGVGYKAEEGKGVITLNVGYSNPVTFILPAEVKATVEKATTIILESNDKELLGQTAAKIRGVRGPEPYKGKGIRYAGERIVRKAGKTGSKK